ncbi:hypothetical protein [Streptomyces caniscabiei]|uniref:hypothetical protein n=1 Tax=Streptomyces caniscabiei TaxID=2746961 RepID=UPI00117CE6DB|nr:hypothetical protein [Streptomyces caniscabiei]
MTRNKAVLAAALTAVIAGGGALTACGGGGETPAPPRAAVTTTEDPLAGMRAAELHRPFTIPSANDDSTFSLTVDGLTDKVDTAKFREDPTLDPSDVVPDPGKKWAIVSVHGINIGDVPAFVLSDEFMLNAGGKTFATDQKWQLNITSAYNDSVPHWLSSETNPEQTAYDWAVYQIPKNFTPTALTVPSGDNGTVIVTLD